MLKLKTKTEFTAPTDRGTVVTIIRFIIDGVSLDRNNITPKGYYYWYDEDGAICQRHIKDITLLETLQQFENNGIVPVLNSNVNVYANLMQRLKELTYLQMKSEEGQNFGTVADDFIEDND